MKNEFDYSDVTSKALDFLKNILLYKYVTTRHYRSRWLYVKEYMKSIMTDFISPAVCILASINC
jgi:hypothetical protein